MKTFIFIFIVTFSSCISFNYSINQKISVESLRPISKKDIFEYYKNNMIDTLIIYFVDTSFLSDFAVKTPLIRVYDSNGKLYDYSICQTDFIEVIKEILSKKRVYNKNETVFFKSEQIMKYGINLMNTNSDSTCNYNIYLTSATWIDSSALHINELIEYLKSNKLNYTLYIVNIDNLNDWNWSNKYAYKVITKHLSNTE